jgi:DNA helicase-2/ATP-dependent DNA helicase PcrA
MSAQVAEPWNQNVKGQQILPIINLDEPVIRVRAGPGTGKTFGIGRRVLRLLHPNGLGLAAADILVCTFNRAIAQDLESQIRSQIEPHGLQLPVVSTIHALAVQFVGAQTRFLLPHEQDTMVFDLLASYPNLRAQYGSQPRAFRALREHEAGLATHTALRQAAANWLAEHYAQLVGDVPRDLERQISQGTPPPHIYRHIIVDEFQDLTDIEARLVLRLRAAGAIFMALGDGKQSIYAFRGNAERGLEALDELVAPTAVTDLTMDECQRCSVQVVNLGNALMELEDEPLVSVRAEPALIRLLHFPTPEAEVKGVAPAVLHTFLQHPADTHLVMVTRRQWGYALRDEIRQLNPDVHVQTVFAEDILETWPVRESFLLLSALGEPDDAPALRAWVGYKTVPDGKGFKADRRNAEAYIRLKATDGVLDIPKVQELADRPIAAFAGSGRGILLERLQRLRTLWAAEDKAASATQMAASILSADRWVGVGDPRAGLARADMDRLRAEAIRLIESDQLEVAALVKRLRYRIATREPLGEPEGVNILIVTLWGAKGLTADWVHIVGLIDEALPGIYDAESTGLTRAEWLDEQRRLLYVSLTRARKGMAISRAQRARAGYIQRLNLAMPSQGNAYWRTLHLTRFLGDLEPGMLPDSESGDAWAGFA